MLCGWDTLLALHYLTPPHHSGLYLHFTSSQKPALMLRVWGAPPRCLLYLHACHSFFHMRERFASCALPPRACKLLEGRDESLWCFQCLEQGGACGWCSVNMDWLNEWMIWFVYVNEKNKLFMCNVSWGQPCDPHGCHCLSWARWGLAGMGGCSSLPRFLVHRLFPHSEVPWCCLSSQAPSPQSQCYSVLSKLIEWRLFGNCLLLRLLIK